MNALLSKLKAFFKDSVDFSKIEKVHDVLNIPVTGLEIIPGDLDVLLKEFNIKTLGDLADYEGDLVIEGFSEEDTNLWIMYAEMIKYYSTAAISNKDKKIMFGKEGRKFIENNFDSEIIWKDLEKIYSR